MSNKDIPFIMWSAKTLLVNIIRWKENEVEMWKTLEKVIP